MIKQLKTYLLLALIVSLTSTSCSLPGTSIKLIKKSQKTFKIGEKIFIMYENPKDDMYIKKGATAIAKNNKELKIESDEKFKIYGETKDKDFVITRIVDKDNSKEKIPVYVSKNNISDKPLKEDKSTKDSGDKKDKDNVTVKPVSKEKTFADFEFEILSKAQNMQVKKDKNGKTEKIKEIEQLNYKTGDKFIIIAISKDKKYGLISENKGVILMNILEKENTTPQPKEPEKKDNVKDKQKEPQPKPNPNKEKEGSEGKSKSDKKPKPEDNIKLGVPYPKTPKGIDIFDGVTFGIVDKKTTIIAGKDSALLNSVLPGAKEVKVIKKGTKLKALSVGSNRFVRVELEDGVTGFVFGDDFGVIK